MNNPTFLHPVTNESVRAVVNSLNPKGNDLILSVCGSGDIPFILVEFSEVIALDILPAQVEYALERKRLLREGNIDKFLAASGRELTEFDKRKKAERDEYFLKNGRIERIRERLDLVRFVKGDIYDYPIKKDRVSKVYLSNTINTLNYSDTCKRLYHFSKSLFPPGLIYISDNDLMEYRKSFAEREGEKIVNPKVTLDLELTRLAEEFERDWHPAVYRKV